VEAGPWTAAEIVRGWTDGRHVPLEAHVTLAGVDEVPRRATTGADGRVDIGGIRAGPATLSVTAPGHVPSTRHGLVASLAPASDPWPADLARTQDDVGTVSDAATGRAVAGARVAMLIVERGRRRFDVPPFVGAELGTTTTDGGGAFRLQSLRPHPWGRVIALRVDRAGYRTVWHLPVDRSLRAPIDVRLVAGRALEGVVVGLDAPPVAGATVVACVEDARRTGPVPDPVGTATHVLLPERLRPGYLRRSDPDGETDGSGALVAITDGEGRFCIDGLGRGETYAVAAFALGVGVFAAVAICPGDPGGGGEVVRLRLETAAGVDVVCLGPARAPRVGIDVSLQPPGRLAVGPVRTDAAGRARFAGLPAGRYMVLAWEHGMPCPVRGPVPATIPFGEDVAFVGAIEAPTRPTASAPTPPSGTTVRARVLRPPTGLPPRRCGSTSKRAAGAVRRPCRGRRTGETTCRSSSMRARGASW